MTAVPAAARAGRTGPEPLLRAKLSRPQPGDQILERSRLLRALGENSARPLTLLVADAGYGKTTLLATYVRSLPRPVVWYSLMPSDADPIVFGRYLLEGFRREHPRFGRDIERALEEGRPGGRLGEMLGGTIAGALAALKGPAHLLVLDDFQEVAGELQVLALVDTLLRHLPERVHTGVGASRAGHRQMCPADSLKCGFQVVLNGVAVPLALPTRKISPVITDNQLEPARFTHLAGRDNFAG